MAIAATAIRTCITELLEGSAGTIRVADGTFEYGAFDGQPDEAKLAKLRQNATGDHWFDIVIGDRRTHEAAAISNRTTNHVVELPITIEVWTGLATEVQESARSTLLSSIADDCEHAALVLAYPGNLTQTSAGVATGVIGGLMRSTGHDGYPSYELVEEDWKSRWVHSRIVGAVIVSAS